MLPRGEAGRGRGCRRHGLPPDNPAGYGRLVEKDGARRDPRGKGLLAEEKQISFCNGGLMAIAGDACAETAGEVGNANAKGEYYLTDVVEIANAAGLNVAPPKRVRERAGHQYAAELAEAEAIWQQRRRREAMLAGVTLIAPETVFFSHDTEFGADVLIEPNVFFGPGVKVASGAMIHAF